MSRCKETVLESINQEVYLEESGGLFSQFRVFVMASMAVPQPETNYESRNPE